MGQAWVVGDVLKWSGTPTLIRENEFDGELHRLADAYGRIASYLYHAACQVQWPATRMSFGRK